MSLEDSVNIVTSGLSLGGGETVDGRSGWLGRARRKQQSRTDTCSGGCGNGLERLVVPGNVPESR